MISGLQEGMFSLVLAGGWLVLCVPSALHRFLFAALGFALLQYTQGPLGKSLLMGIQFGCVSLLVNPFRIHDRWLPLLMAATWTLLSELNAQAYGVSAWSLLTSATLAQGWILKKSWKHYALWALLISVTPLYTFIPKDVALFCSLLFIAIFFSRMQLNLGMQPEPFVLEEKKIEIPGYPHAYNGSIVRWKERLLLSFRVSSDQRRQSQNYLIWLDETFEIIGRPQRLGLPLEAEDIRLVSNGDRLYMLYTHAGDWMAVGELQCEGGIFSLKELQPFLQFEGKSFGRMEKNWTPFFIENTLLLSYSLQPHVVLNALGRLVAKTESSHSWAWGELRGGTPAMRVDEHRYLAFFHSQKWMSSVHSKGMSTLHYFLGAYTFATRWPYSLLAISPRPIVGTHFYGVAEHTQLQRTPVNVVYPCGIVVSHEEVWVSYGRHDRELWIAKLDKEKLLESLI